MKNETLTLKQQFNKQIREYLDLRRELLDLIDKGSGDEADGKHYRKVMLLQGKLRRFNMDLGKLRQQINDVEFEIENNSYINTLEEDYRMWFLGIYGYDR